MHHPIPRRWPWLAPRCHCGARRYRDCLALMRAVKASGATPPPYVEPKHRPWPWGDDPESRTARHRY